MTPAGNRHPLEDFSNGRAYSVGYWLTEAMKSVFIAAEGWVRIMNVHTGTLMDMIAEPATYGAAIVAAHALAFLLIAYLVTLLRHGRHSRST